MSTLTTAAPLTCYTAGEVWKHVCSIEGVENWALGWHQRVTPLPYLEKASSIGISSWYTFDGLCVKREIATGLGMANDHYWINI